MPTYREQLVHQLQCPGAMTEQGAVELADEARREGLLKAIGRLRAIPVTCTALTGPVWYGTGWKECITALEDIADYQRPDDEAHPGEVQRLRVLALQLRVAVLRKEDLADAQRLLVSHAEHEAQARDGQTQPDFYEVGHTYTDDEYDWKFRVDIITTHPENGERIALGWRFYKGQWAEMAYGEDSWEIHQIAGYTDITETGEGR